MGRPLGAYDTDELDRPDLNKCPDCGCFFATDECTLCGKLCPEEMRAGNRKKVKQKKRRRGGYTGRVQFVPWYYTWPAMIIISLVMPLAGVVLFFTSPYSKKVKIAVVAVVLAWQVLIPVLFSFGLPLVMSWFEEPLVNDEISREEYVSLCEDMSAEDFHRYYETDRYISMELTVSGKLVDDYGDTYYLCTDAAGGEQRTIFIMDCQLEEHLQFIEGDTVRVWGQSGGLGYVVVDGILQTELPCLYIAYAELIS